MIHIKFIKMCEKMVSVSYESFGTVYKHHKFNPFYYQRLLILPMHVLLMHTLSGGYVLSRALVYLVKALSDYVDALFTHLSIRFVFR